MYQQNRMNPTTQSKATVKMRGSFQIRISNSTGLKKGLGKREFLYKHLLTFTTVFLITEGG